MKLCKKIGFICMRRLYSSKTCLYDFHLSKDAKMTDFAGYLMPLLYKSHSIIESHKFVRRKCGLFDVSHMLQFQVSGSNRRDLMHRLIVADMDSLPNSMSTLSLFTNEQGGIMDDLIAANCADLDHYYIVSNAGCAEKVKQHLSKYETELQRKGGDVKIHIVKNGLIALQGPSMKSVLQPGVDFSLDDLYFGMGRYCSVFGIKGCRVTRCGYTGEDGVEISVPQDQAPELADTLLLHPDVIPVGLGARDTLRLEAGLCLYGNDIDETTTPSEAALSWTIGKNRKDPNNDIKFLGFESIMKQLTKQNPITKKRVGLQSTKGPPARSGAEVVSLEGETIGHITSGCFSPELAINISMGYVNKTHFKVGTDVQFKIRGKLYPATVVKMPFVPTKYYTLPKK